MDDLMRLLRRLPDRYHRLAAALTIANWTVSTDYLTAGQVLLLRAEGPGPYEIRAKWSASSGSLVVEDALGSQMNILNATRYILANRVVR